MITSILGGIFLACWGLVFGAVFGKSVIKESAAMTGEGIGIVLFCMLMSCVGWVWLGLRLDWI